jgi:COMPASS component SWD2
MTLRSWKSEKLQMGSVIMGDGAVNSLDFSRNGKLLVMSTKESSIHLIDVMTGTEKKKIYAKSNGICSVKYTHHEYGVIATSEWKNNDIRYISLYDNRYLRLFSGHTDKVTSISMHPTEDYFISASSDRSVQLWSLSHVTPVAKLFLPNYCGRLYASYDASGLVFGVLCFDSKQKLHSLRLFDSRNYESGPFQDIAPTSLEKAIAKSPTTSAQSQKILQAPWTSFEFSPDGQRILVNTSTDVILALDSFSPDNDPLIITGRKNDMGASLGTCMSADGQSIISGNDDNEILIYDVQSGELRNTLSGHVAPVGCVKCNSRYDVMAAGCVNTALWI